MNPNSPRGEPLLLSPAPMALPKGVAIHAKWHIIKGMNQLIDTNEFGVALLTDEITAAKVTKIRRQLPPSPIRVDPPHMTLLRGVSSSNEKTDAELLSDIEPLVKPLVSSNTSVTISRLLNLDSQLYGSTGVIELKVPQEILEVRQNLISSLISKGYIVEQKEKEKFQPHLTLVLSIPLPDSDDLLKIISILDGITFSSWAIFRTRLRKPDGTRLVRIIKPSR